MTKEQAEALGYRLIMTSPFEWGLVKGEQGIKTWWHSQLGMSPTLENTKVQEAIRIFDETLGNRKP